MLAGRCKILGRPDTKVLKLSQNGIFAFPASEQGNMAQIETYANSSNPGRLPMVHMARGKPLTETRQAGQRLREEWLADLARKSRLNSWTPSQIVIAVQQGALDAALAQTLRTASSVNEAIRQGRIAAHPFVRNEFDRLVKLRDDVWLIDPVICRRYMHGPSQILIDLITRCRNPAERHHVADDASYLSYIHSRLAARKLNR
jgi:hypothetical protein